MNSILSAFLLTSSLLNTSADTPTVLEKKAESFYIYKEGSGKEKKELYTNTFLTLNVCMFKGRLPSLFGGTTAPVAQRAERLAQFLKEQSPDIFVAQEVPLESGEILYEALKEQYPHFWMGIGLKPGEEESDLFVASKYPIISQPTFVPYPDEMQRIYKLPADIQKIYPKRIIERGFFCLETEEFLLVTTHLEPGDRESASSYRARQIAFLTEKMDQISKETGKPYILAGDLNVTRTAQADDEYSTTSKIPELYYDFYTENHPGFDDSTYTCTNLLTFWVNNEPIPKDPRELNEIDDYILIRKHQKESFANLDVRLLTHTYDLSKDPYEALSDHRAYRVSFSVN